MGRNNFTYEKGYKSKLIKDETGNKYNKLTVIEQGEKDKYGTIRWICQCDCGNKTLVGGYFLRSGKTKSCGCIKGGVVRSGNALYNHIFSQLRGYSKKKNLPFDLSVEHIKELSHGKCTYCKRLPYIEKAAYHRTRYSTGEDEILALNGVDKVIPSLGYIRANCVSCCKYCNRAKSDLTIDEFKNLITLLYNNFVK